MDTTKSATWTDHHFSLADTERPVVTTHDEAVMFSHPGFMRDGTGFALRFTRHHLGVVRELLAALEALPLLPGEVDVQVMADCPTCHSKTTISGMPCSFCRDQFAYEADRR